MAYWKHRNRRKGAIPLRESIRKEWQEKYNRSLNDYIKNPSKYKTIVIDSLAGYAEYLKDISDPRD